MAAAPHPPPTQQPKDSKRAQESFGDSEDVKRVPGGRSRGGRHSPTTLTTAGDCRSIPRPRPFRPTRSRPRSKRGSPASRQLIPRGAVLESGALREEATRRDSRASITVDDRGRRSPVGRRRGTTLRPASSWCSPHGSPARPANAGCAAGASIVRRLQPEACRPDRAPRPQPTAQDESESELPIAVDPVVCRHHWRRRPLPAPLTSLPRSPHPSVRGVGAARLLRLSRLLGRRFRNAHACNRQLGHPADDSPGNTGRGRSTPGDEHRRGTGLPSSRRRTGVSPPSRRRLIPVQRDNADSDGARARHPAVEHQRYPRRRLAPPSGRRRKPAAAECWRYPTSAFWESARPGAFMSRRQRSGGS